MANFLISAQILCLLNFIMVARSESYFEGFSSKLSEKLNDLTQAIERIDERLDKIERIVGIADDHPVNDYDEVLNVKKEQTAFIDIKRAKHIFMKAFASEKRYLNGFVSEYVDKFVELQKNVKERLSEMNDTIKESNKKITEEIAENTNNVSGLLNQMDAEANLQFNDMARQIDTVNITATLARGSIETDMQNVEERLGNIENKQHDHGKDIGSVNNRVSSLRSDHNNKFSTLESRMNSFNGKQESSVRSLDSRVSSIKSSLDTRISSLSSRITTLVGTKVVFSAFLSSTKYYGKDSVIVFDGTIYTYGGGYSTSTGKFTAPKSGTYLFSLSVEGTSREIAYAQIKSYENGSETIRGQARSGEDSFATGSSTLVYYLSKGEQMWVKAGAYGEFSHSRTSFMGVLLY